MDQSWLLVLYSTTAPSSAEVNKLNAPLLLRLSLPVPASALLAVSVVKPTNSALAVVSLTKVMDRVPSLGTFEALIWRT